MINHTIMVDAGTDVTAEVQGGTDGDPRYVFVRIGPQLILVLDATVADDLADSLIEVTADTKPAATYQPGRSQW